MSRSLVRLAVLSLSTVLLSLCGCEESNSPGRKFDLIVEVESEGAPEVTQIQIRGGTFGTGQTFVFPQLPFARLLSATGSETVEVEVDGRSLNGRILVRMRDDPVAVPESTIYATGECGPNVPVCNIVVRNTF